MTSFHWSRPPLPAPRPPRTKQSEPTPTITHVTTLHARIQHHDRTSPSETITATADTYDQALAALDTQTPAGWIRLAIATWPI